MSYRQYQEESSTLQRELAVEKERSNEISVSSIRKESLYQEEKAKLECIITEQKQEIESIRHTSDLLHGQVQSLGVQVDRLLEGKATIALTSTSLTTSLSGGSGEGVTDASTGAGGVASTVVLQEEVKELRHTSSELREVVRYIKVCILYLYYTCYAYHAQFMHTFSRISCVHTILKPRVRTLPYYNCILCIL